MLDVYIVFHGTIMMLRISQFIGVKRLQLGDTVVKTIYYSVTDILLVVNF